MEEQEEAAGKIDCELLVTCLEKIELNFSNFLQEDGGKFLLRKIKQLYTDPDKAMVDLSDSFKHVVDPLLLEQFNGTWMGFLLWDDFNKKFHVLHNYPSQKPDDINPTRYAFLSRFLSFSDFKDNFQEPMSNIIFRKRTQKKVLVFDWPRLSQGVIPAAAAQKDEPVMIDFRGLDADAGLAKKLDDIRDFVDEKKDHSGHAERLAFKELAEQIFSLEKEFLSTAAKGVLERAAQEIDDKFKLTGETESLITAAALCRALIWNRLFDDKWQYIYYIPAKFLENSTASGIVCAFENCLSAQEYTVLTQIVNRIFSLFHFGLYLQRINLFALRSATAAIMARNKSHIHGSHIEHGLRNKMDTYEQIIKDRLATDDTFYKTLVKKLTLDKHTAL